MSAMIGSTEDDSPRQRSLWGDFEQRIDTESSLVAAALSLSTGCGVVPTSDDSRLWKALGKPKFSNDAYIGHLAAQIARGHDPLGDAFCAIRSTELRRDSGATYTPKAIVDAMIEWALLQEAPARIVDPGCGSARFLLAAGHKLPSADLIGIERDPIAALLARANLAVSGFSQRSRVLLGDYRTFTEGIDGRTLYIGNPPYVRHHKIDLKWKNWLFEESAKLGHPASKLAGLHVYFLLATAVNARAGDAGIFITAAEWLDVNYGSLVRNLLLEQLGGKSVTVIEPTAQPFPDAATTAAISTFEIGSRATAFSFKRVEQISDLKDFDRGRKIHRDRLTNSMRWSHLTRSGEKPAAGYVELGELCRVHRGQVTGANDVWIAGTHSEGLPDSVLFRTITRAREVIAAEGRLDNAEALRSVIDLPVDLDALSSGEKRAIVSFLKKAKHMGANRGYVATHRKAWWAVGLRSPAPIVSTYMARRPPAFVLNKAQARHINIAHGLYPRTQLSDHAQQALVNFLQANVSQKSGRTYAGGLTKFEPREMERLVVPGPELLAVAVLN